jgi:tetratricopeptide (TPR) repeat protein
LKYRPDSLAFAFIAYWKASSYFDLNQLPQAKDDLDLAESIFVKLRDKTTLLQINILRTQIALKENHQQLAARLFEVAMSTADTNHIGQLLKNQIILLKSEILATEGKYEEALFYNRRYLKLNDQLHKEQKVFNFFKYSQKTNM